MKSLRPILFLLLACSFLFAADSPWQYGRIGDVRKSVSTYTKAWVANTPIEEEQTSYIISVHLQDKLLVGNYDLTPEQAAPPPEWTTNYPVKVQVQGDSMFLRSPMGDIRLRISQRKTSRPMLPLTAEEKKRLAEIEAPAQSLTGFSEAPKPEPAKAAEAPPQPPPPPPNVGTVTVRSTPYLSEIFVDGDSMGYTPAKINLPPGKHTFRVEKSGYKAWTKEMTITVGSELTLDASLEKK